MDKIDRKALDEYDEEGARNYESSGGMRNAQYEMSRRAVELLDLCEDAVVLDVGCGTGFSMEILREENGFNVKGVDISPWMIEISRKKGFDVSVANMNKLPFENCSFDGIVSISTLQWVEGYSLDEMSLEYLKCANEMFRVLKNSGKCVVQFYPRLKDELKLAVKSFKKSGFSVRLIVDEGGSHQKADKKFILAEKL